ncbi:hypothetical protein N566_03225 [Streptomycetaceae bacterium MP113-05]|nr:hypothetical protein N566_03225 [Streptomycetaceae bacterium MP113-05]
MESDGQLELYDRLAARLKEAHTRVRTLQVPEGVRVALARKLLVITAASKHGPAAAERRLGRLMTDIDEGRFPDERGGERGAEDAGERRDGSADGTS